MNPGCSDLVQKAVSMDEQNKMPAEKEDQDDGGKSRHYGPEADVVHQPEEWKRVGERDEKVAEFIYHEVFLAALYEEAGAPGG